MLKIKKNFTRFPPNIFFTQIRVLGSRLFKFRIQESSFWLIKTKSALTVLTILTKFGFYTNSRSINRNAKVSNSRKFVLHVVFVKIALIYYPDHVRQYFAKHNGNNTIYINPYCLTIIQFVYYILLFIIVRSFLNNYNLFLL